MNTKAYTLTPKVTGVYKTLPQPNTTYVSPACDGQPANSPDKRFPANLPNVPFQITTYVPYFDSHLEYAKSGQCELFGAYVGDPIHRFYQMWQENAYNQRLYTWTANTAGDDNGAIPPQPIFQGGLQMGYYTMAEGDAPILPNPAPDVYVPKNRPAIGDLMTLFNFSSPNFATLRLPAQRLGAVVAAVGFATAWLAGAGLALGGGA